ncbi:sigma-70 family RNA polymerase sigma factor [Rosistilla oblonga]|uniref:sigma-70 family RNA polymerase sigma factor n=1 Tax=Rosistilla oblonga TaxID=2527990 RepID=UPI003A977ED9
MFESDAAAEDDLPPPRIDPENWVDRYGDAMYRYAYSKLGDHGVAEEAVQESFVAALRARDSFRGDSSVSTWLFAILRRKIVDHYRRRNVREVTLAGDGEQAAPKSRSLSSRHRWGDDPAAMFEEQEFWETFDRCVDKLPDKLAEVHLLREGSQHRPKEICKILGISATNLSMRLHRSRLALRDCLQKNWFQDDGFA